MPEIEYIGPLDKKEDVGDIEYVGPLDEGIQQPNIGDVPILDDIYIPPGIDRQQVKEAEIDAKTINELFGTALTPAAAHKLRPHIDQHIEDSWGQIFVKSAKSVYPAFMTGAGGLIRAFEEVSRIPGEKPVFEPGTIVPTGKEIADYWGGILKEQDINAADSKLKRYAGMIIQNVAQNAPMLVVGAATGGAALPLTVFGLQSGGQKFQQMREEGQGTGTSLVGGSIVGLSEAMTELLPFEALIKPGVSFAKRLVLSASLDVPGELVNTAVEASVDKVTITPDMTIEDFGKALAETAIVSLGSAGLLTTMAHPIVWAREEQAKKDKLIESAKEEENKTMIAEQETITTEAIQEIQDKVEAAPAEEVVTEISEQDFENAFDNMVMSEKEVEESTLDTMMQEEPVKPLAGIEHEVIAPDENINSITREEAGKMIAEGDTEVIRHIQEGVAEKGSLAMQDAIRNQEMIEIAKAKKGPEREAVKAHIQEIEPEIDKALKGEAPVSKVEKIKIVKDVMKFTPSQKQTLQQAIKDISSGELVKNQGLKDPEGYFTGETLRGASMYPEYFKNKGYTSKEVLGVLKKALNGQPLKKKQQVIVEDINQGIREQWAGELKEQRATKEVTAWDLQEGDKLKRHGETYTVKAVDDTEFEPKVVIKNSETLTLTGDETIKYDRGTLKKGEAVPVNILNESGAIDITKFVELGKTIWDEGHITYQAFKTRVQEVVGEMWNKVKTEVLKVWEMVKEFNEKLGEEGAVRLTLGEREKLKQLGYTHAQISKLPQTEIDKLFPVREQIKKTTGQVKQKGEISEPEALRAAMVKAVQAGKAAYMAGKSEELAKAKERFKKIGMRRQKVKAILDALAMPDETIKQITRKNFLLMTDFEFKNFMDDLKEKSLELEEKAIAKATLDEVLIRKRLKKYDNYRRALELPPIHKMTTEQLFEFADILDQFQEDDVFLTERELETVDKTDLEGIRTWREARERLAKEANVSIEELSQVKVTWWDKFRWDTPLAEANPFYGLMVGETTKKLLQAVERSYKVEAEVKELAKKANASRKRTITERLIPQEKQIMDYLESPDDMKAALANEMTGEQLELAQYMEQYFADALNHLIAIKTLDKGRENYYTHIRRSFLEVAKDDGLVKAFKELFQSYQEEQMVFNILDEDTGNILPLEKFFQFSLRRTGVLTPTQNVLKAFMVYVKTFEKKVALDELIPKIDIYAQSLTPTRYTPRGLEIDRSLKKFVNKYINNKKGRHIDMGFVKQGDKVDLAIRALRTFTTLLDLGLNIPIGIASLIGEHAANFEMIGIKGLALAKKRQYTARGKTILEKYKNFTGHSVWEEFNAPGKEVTERLLEGMFGLFHQATVMANKEFLLASITEDEYNSGTISDERLATLRLEMGRFRVVPGTKSLVGSTSVGSAGMQYKTWAGAIARTVIKDIETLVTDIKNKPLGQALTTREAREIYRIIGMVTAILIVFGIGDDKDRSTIGRLKYLVWRESLSVLQAISPDMWLSTPRIMGLISQLGQNLKSLIMLEEYKTKPGLKGVGGLKKQFTPAVLRKQDKKKEASR